MKKAKILISVLSISLLIGFLGCNRADKKKDGSAWEKDMNKLIEKATPKEAEKSY